ncbi:hypothetical protein [Micromonospora sp. NBC_01638]|uniref:hypothetical protein n=1 Tax=Micromonospora sp. NBC_01638 TaxID=2975982 RepID=UPI00386E569C|nr:hypothetical protein OG811_22785 [Micromonospora sp. NBC_01638]
MQRLRRARWLGIAPELSISDVHPTAGPVMVLHARHGGRRRTTAVNDDNADQGVTSE